MKPATSFVPLQQLADVADVARDYRKGYRPRFSEGELPGLVETLHRR